MRQDEKVAVAVGFFIFGIMVCIAVGGMIYSCNRDNDEELHIYCDKYTQFDEKPYKDLSEEERNCIQIHQRLYGLGDK